MFIVESVLTGIPEARRARERPGSCKVLAVLKKEGCLTLHMALECLGIYGWRSARG